MFKDKIQHQAYRHPPSRLPNTNSIGDPPLLNTFFSNYSALYTKARRSSPTAYDILTFQPTEKNTKKIAQKAKFGFHTSNTLYITAKNIGVQHNPTEMCRITLITLYLQRKILPKFTDTALNLKNTFTFVSCLEMRQ